MALPSLNALRALETVMRHGSFVDAASEMGVTAAAVSQLIRGLEERIGRQLFHRSGNRITPTEAALDIYPGLADGFRFLGEAANRLENRGIPQRLTLSVPPSMATTWLPRNMPSFLTSGQKLDLIMRGDEDPISFEGDRIDLRLCFGADHYPGLERLELSVDAAYPLAARELATDMIDEDPEVWFQKLPLIHTDWGPVAARFPGWQSWIGHAGLDEGRMSGYGHRANSSHLAIELATNGLGVVLAQGLLAEHKIKSGELVCLPGPSVPLSAPYCLVWPKERARYPGFDELRDWLATSVTTSVEGWSKGYTDDE